jgi:hypothetical protein
VWTEFSWLRTGASGSRCEHGNKTSSSINAGNSCVAERLLASQGLSSVELVMEVMDVQFSLLSNSLDPLSLPQCPRFSD